MKLDAEGGKPSHVLCPASLPGALDPVVVDDLIGINSDQKILSLLLEGQHGKKRVLEVSSLPQPCQADGGSHQRWKQMATGGGATTWLLAVWGRLPVSSAAGSSAHQ